MRVTFMSTSNRSDGKRGQAHKHQFIDDLLRWIRTSAFSAVILLTGIDPTNRTDAQML